MPTYLYECSYCDEMVEVDAPGPPKRVTCGNCGYRGMKRVYTPVAVQFKGEGFYSTDNRDKPKE